MTHSDRRRLLPYAVLVALLPVGLVAPAVAGGASPDAVADGATVAEGGTITLLDGAVTSVLANDVDPEGDQLTAVAGAGPAQAGSGSDRLEVHPRDLLKGSKGSWCTRPDGGRRPGLTAAGARERFSVGQPGSALC